ncbi:MAG TPA: hypothetical protein P5526_06980 [Anaerolineae bacterium]|nr:hypothetical protein [Anaerolineae bacterium]
MMQPIQNNYEPTQPQPPLPDHPTAHPLYHMVEHFINQGDWQAARAPLEELLTLYPDDPYLQELAPSVRTRSALLGYAEEEYSSDSEPRFKLEGPLKFVIPGLIFIVLLCLVGSTMLALQIWGLPGGDSQRVAARVSQLHEQAQDALDSGDYDRAVVAYSELLQLHPDDQQAQQGLEQARALRSTMSLYSEAIAEMEAHHWESSLAIFKQIEAAQPGYRDVANRIQFVQEQQLLTSQFSDAEADFSQGNYERAIQGYETLQEINSNFQSDTVREHLFLSYLQQGLTVESAAGDDPEQLAAALDLFEIALILRPGDSQARGESQLIKLYLESLEYLEDERWANAVENLNLIYDARPSFANASVGPLLYDAYVAWGDDLFEYGEFAEAQTKYEAARLIRGVDTSNIGRKLALAKAAQETPTPTPSPEPTAAPSTGSGGGGGGGGQVALPTPTPTATPVPQPYALTSMAIRNNCSGQGYIHGVVWNAYHLPLSGVTVQAFNLDNGAGPLISGPSNGDGIYQIIVEGDQIPGLWMVQVLENGQPVSEAMGQRLGGECLNGAQELKVDWQRNLQFE